MTCVTVVDKDIYQFFGGKDMLEDLKVGIRQKTNIYKKNWLPHVTFQTFDIFQQRNFLLQRQVTAL